MILSNLLRKSHIAECLWIPLKLLSLLEVDRLKKSLTIYKKYDGTEIKLFKVNDAFIGVPIHHFKLPKGIPDSRTAGAIIKFEFTSPYRKGQPEAVCQFREYWLSGGTGFIIEAVPGWGKTCVCIKLMSIVGRTSLVIVPRSNLVKQWVSRLIEHSTLKRSEIGIAMGGVVEYINKKVVVGLVHTVSKDRFMYDDNFKNYFGMIVFDEVDRSVPPQTFSTVASMFPARIRIGVSAILSRKDGLDVIFKKHIGQHYIKADDEGTTLKPKVIIHNYNTSSGEVPKYLQKLQRRGVLLSRLAENNNRNGKICGYVKLIYNSGRQCLVISDRIKQLQSIKRFLVSTGGIPDSEIGFYVRQLYSDNGDSKKTVTESERKRVTQDCKIILATYGMMSLGTDIVSLAGLIMATPQSEVKQTIGRIVRKMKGKQQPVIVDIVDSAYPDAVGWGHARQRYYAQENLLVKHKGQ